MKTKIVYPKNYSIGYAYESSTWANNFGLSNGGYIVECRQGLKPPKAISGHVTKEEAIDALKKARGE
jgi:hypothetical protein